MKTLDIVKNWSDRKELALARINSGKVFINPRSDAKNWQAAMELVGEGKVAFDGCYFSPNITKTD